MSAGKMLIRKPHITYSRSFQTAILVVDNGEFRIDLERNWPRPIWDPYPHAVTKVSETTVYDLWPDQVEYEEISP